MKAAQADDLYLASIGFPDAAKHKRARNVALHEAHAAIETELGIVHKHSTEAEQDEPSTGETELVLRAPLTPDEVRENLASFKEKHNLGQVRIGELCGLSQSQISRFLAGSSDLSPESRRAIETMIEKESNRR